MVTFHLNGELNETVRFNNLVATVISLFCHLNVLLSRQITAIGLKVQLYLDFGLTTCFVLWSRLWFVHLTHQIFGAD